MKILTTPSPAIEDMNTKIKNYKKIQIEETRIQNLQKSVIHDFKRLIYLKKYIQFLIEMHKHAYRWFAYKNYCQFPFSFFAWWMYCLYNPIVSENQKSTWFNYAIYDIQNKLKLSQNQFIYIYNQWEKNKISLLYHNKKINKQLNEISGGKYMKDWLFYYSRIIKSLHIASYSYKSYTRFGFNPFPLLSYYYRNKSRIILNHSFIDVVFDYWQQSNCNFNFLFQENGVIPGKTQYQEYIRSFIQNYNKKFENWYVKSRYN